MISFIKLLKITLPLATATTATFFTVSLISSKKLDSIDSDIINKKELTNFVSLDEGFEEKIINYSDNGKNKEEEVSKEDLKKAEEAIENLKQEGTKKDSAFKSQEEAIQFLNDFPKKTLNELLQKNGLSDNDLDKFGNLGDLIKQEKTDLSQKEEKNQNSGVTSLPEANQEIRDSKPSVSQDISSRENDRFSSGPEPMIPQNQINSGIQEVEENTKALERELSLDAQEIEIPSHDNIELPRENEIMDIDLKVPNLEFKPDFEVPKGQETNFLNERTEIDIPEIQLPELDLFKNLLNNGNMEGGITLEELQKLAGKLIKTEEKLTNLINKA